MAVNLGGLINARLRQFSLDTAEREYIAARTPFMEVPSEDTKRNAKEFRDYLDRTDKIGEYMEATAAKPCPECGRV